MEHDVPCNIPLFGATACYTACGWVLYLMPMKGPSGVVPGGGVPAPPLLLLRPSYDMQGPLGLAVGGGVPSPPPPPMLAF